MKKSLLNIAVAAILGSAALPAAAWQAGDLIGRIGAAGVFPDGDGGVVPAAAPGRVEADDSWSLGLTGTWMMTDSIGIGLLAAWPFEHDIKGAGTLAGAGKVGDTKQLPPTVTAQYHFNTSSSVHPYIGAGINYTNFFSESTTGALAGDSLKLDDSWGLAAEAGVDFELDNDLLVSAQLWYVDIDTDATVAGTASGLAGSFNVEIDPWVVMIGIGKKF